MFAFLFKGNQIKYSLNFKLGNYLSNNHTLDIISNNVVYCTLTLNFTCNLIKFINLDFQIYIYN